MRQQENTTKLNILHLCIGYFKQICLVCLYIHIYFGTLRIKQGGITHFDFVRSYLNSEGL